MDLLTYWAIISAIYINLINGEIRILDLKVPSTIESGSHDEVILDCEYEVDGDGLQGLVVKWFYNGDNQSEQQIYQWIPNSSRPQALGFLKDRVDLSYKASNDTNTMYRALRIRDITTDLSGDYTCKVTSHFDEDTITKKMVIYEPPSEFELLVIEESETVICTVAGIFPQPKLHLYILGLEPNSTSSENSNEEDDEEDTEHTSNIGEEVIEGDGVFNVTSILTFQTEDLSGYTTFICDLTIPDTTFKMQRKQYLYSDNSSWIRSPSSTLLSVFFLWSVFQNLI